MEKSGDYKIVGMTIAITNMDAMLAFYTAVFDLEFTPLDMYGSKLFSTTWGGLKLLFCPAHIAQNTASQNRHQFDLIVPDLEEIIRRSTLHGGVVMGAINEDLASKSVGIYDPDMNSIAFKEMK